MVTIQFKMILICKPEENPILEFTQQQQFHDKHY